MTRPRALPRLGSRDLDELSASAAASTRLRRNRNLHSSLDEPIHRLLNAVEPGTYVRPHRHLDPPRTESMVVLSGALGLLTFDDAGEVQETLVLSAGGPDLLCELPPETWHTVVSLRSGTVFFEVKAGPYVPPAGPDVAAWAPAEGEARARTFLETWRKLLTVDQAGLHPGFIGI